MAMHSGLSRIGARVPSDGLRLAKLPFVTRAGGNATVRMTRVYVDAPLATGEQVRLPDEAARHLATVLRLRRGDKCWLFCGDGMEYRAELVESNKQGVVALLEDSRATPAASPLPITLIQGIARGEKMDLILQKATELGVAAIAPVFCRRSEVRLQGERLDKRVQHWLGVVRSACEQSGRSELPRLLEPVDLARYLAGQFDAPGRRFRLDPSAGVGLASVTGQAPECITLLVGPEGGLAEEDHAAAEAAGFEPLRLGPRVLRTETAGLAAIAVMQGLWGDLGR